MRPLEQKIQKPYNCGLTLYAHCKHAITPRIYAKTAKRLLMEMKLFRRQCTKTKDRFTFDFICDTR